MIEVLIDGMTNSKGGKESYVINAITSMDSSKFNFTFVAEGGKIAYEDLLTKYGWDIIRLPSRNSGLFNYRSAIKKMFLKKKYDVVWSHKTTLSSCEILEIAKKFNVPIRIIHSHSSSNMGGRLTYALHSINKLFIRKFANVFFACSTTAAKWFFGNKSFIQIKNGIDTEKFRFNNETRKRIRSELDLDEYFVIGHVGRFGVEKNHKKVIDVFKKVHEAKKNSKLILCGDGEERKKIEQQIKDLSLESDVILLGMVDNMSEILQAIDVLIMPSLFEGLPFAIIEAQASGLKCIVSDTISVESDILGLNCFLPILADDKVWAEQIIETDLNYDRHSFADKIKFKGFDVSDCTNMVESLIETSLSK